MMKLHYSTSEVAQSRYRKINAVVSATKIKIQQVALDYKADLSKLSTIGTLPLLQTSQGVFTSSNTIIRYLASFSGFKLYGENNLHDRALIDQWLDAITCEFQTAVTAISVVKSGQEVDLGALLTDINKFLGIIQQHLTNKKFLVGDTLSISDLSLASNLQDVLINVFGQNERKRYPNVTKWYLSIAEINQNVGIKNLPKQCDKKFAQKKKKNDNKAQEQIKQEEQKENKKEEPQNLAPKEVQDDLFGESQTPASATPVPAQKPKKAKPIAKSIIAFDVKVYEEDEDLDKLAEKIKANISKDGLVWAKGYKILPVVFTMKKLQMSCVVEDAKVSVDDFYEQIQQWDEVQSIDTVSFQKL